MSEEVVYVIENGWLVERIDRCTCSPHFGAHERHCGAEPIGKLEDVLAAAAESATLRARLDEVRALAATWEGCLNSCGYDEPSVDEWGTNPGGEYHNHYLLGRDGRGDVSGLVRELAHAWAMSTARHKPDCPSQRPGPVRRSGPEEVTLTLTVCTGCVTDADRVLWAQLAAEYQAQLDRHRQETLL